MSATTTLCLAETQRLAEWWDSFTVHIGDRLGYALMESCSGSLQWANYRVSASYVIGFRSVIGFPCLVLCRKRGQNNRETGSQWPTPGHYRPTAAESAVWLSEMVAAKLWARDLLSSLVWPLSICIFISQMAFREDIRNSLDIRVVLSQLSTQWKNILGLRYSFAKTENPVLCLEVMIISSTHPINGAVVTLHIVHIIKM